MDINGLSPYIAYYTFDRERRLAWCIDSINCALSYYRSMTGEQLSYSELISRFHDERVVYALIFGALVVGDTVQTPGEFKAIMPDDIGFAFNAMFDGMSHFLPVVEDHDDLTEDLDDDYPETRQPKKEKEREDLDFYPSFAQLISKGFTVQDIGQMTLRGIVDFINASVGVKEDYEWLNENG